MNSTLKPHVCIATLLKQFLSTHQCHQIKFAFCQVVYSFLLAFQICSINKFHDMSNSCHSSFYSLKYLYCIFSLSNTHYIYKSIAKLKQLQYTSFCKNTHICSKIIYPNAFKLNRMSKIYYLFLLLIYSILCLHLASSNHASSQSFTHKQSERSVCDLN